MDKKDIQTGAIPVWKRYALTITEAAEYYHIGEQAAHDSRGTPRSGLYYYERQPHFDKTAEI